MRVRDVVIGAGVGAALVWMFDPDMGRRRRALLREKVVRIASTRSPGDARIVERVRATLVRVASHPFAIHVESEEGEVTLRGLVLASDINRVLASVATIRGVRGILNELEPHDSAEEVPTFYGQDHSTHIAGDTRR